MGKICQDAIRRIHFIVQEESRPDHAGCQMRTDRVQRERVRQSCHRGTISMLKRAADAECVSAPTEMRSGPAAASSRTLLKVTPPDTSTVARPLISSTALRIADTVMLSSRMISAPPSRAACTASSDWRSEEHTSELQSLTNLVCRLL